MKKSELREGVAYYVHTRNESPMAWRDSVYKIHEQNQSARKYIIFRGGEPMSYRGTPSSIYATPCKNFRNNCEQHPEGGRFDCPMDDVRLMDIRGEYWELIKQTRDKVRNKKSKDIRAERLARIAKRQTEDYEKPIRDDFYATMREALGSYVSSYDRIGGLSIEQMKLISEALKAHQRAGKAVA